MITPASFSGFDFPIWVAGSDDVLFILDVKAFERDNDLDNEVAIDGFSCELVAGEAPRTRLATFSISGVEFRYLKLSLGKTLFMDDFPFSELEAL